MAKKKSIRKKSESGPLQKLAQKLLPGAEKHKLDARHDG